MTTGFRMSFEVSGGTPFANMFSTNLAMVSRLFTLVYQSPLVSLFSVCLCLCGCGLQQKMSYFLCNAALSDNLKIESRNIKCKNVIRE